MSSRFLNKRRMEHIKKTSDNLFTLISSPVKFKYTGLLTRNKTKELKREVSIYRDDEIEMLKLIVNYIVEQINKRYKEYSIYFQDDSNILAVNFFFLPQDEQLNNTILDTIEEDSISDDSNDDYRNINEALIGELDIKNKQITNMTKLFTKQLDQKDEQLNRRDTEIVEKDEQIKMILIQLKETRQTNKYLRYILSFLLVIFLTHYIFTINN
jgi:hypothetical protein